MSSATLEIKNISKSYIKRWTRTNFTRCIKNFSFKSTYNQALSTISFDVLPSEIICVDGANGAGKSTLLKILADRLAPTTGNILRRGSVMPIISMGACMHGLLTVRQNIKHAFVMFSGEYPNKSTIDQILELSGLLNKADDLLQTLSFGMISKLSLAIGLNIQADVYLIDELLDPLDKEARSSFCDKIKSKVKEGSSIVFVSHDKEIAKQLSARLIELKN